MYAPYTRFARARQRIETMINEEALFLSKFLRDETKTWNPRIALSIHARLARKLARAKEKKE